MIYLKFIQVTGPSGFITMEGKIVLKVLFSCCSILCLMPGISLAENHENKEPEPSIYTSFVIKIPYSFDLPPEIVGILLGCGIYKDGLRSGPAWDVLIRLKSGKGSGEVLTGFDELGTHQIEDVNRFPKGVEKQIKEYISEDRFKLRADCQITKFATNSYSMEAYYKDSAQRVGLFTSAVRTEQTEAKAWLSDDYFQTNRTKRTFNSAENEALGKLPGMDVNDLQTVTITNPIEDQNLNQNVPAEAFKKQ